MSDKENKPLNKITANNVPKPNCQILVGRIKKARFLASILFRINHNTKLIKVIKTTLVITKLLIFLVIPNDINKKKGKIK